MDKIFGAQASFLVDFYHVCDYLAAAGKSCADSPELWMELQKQRLKTNQWALILDDLRPHLEPSSVKDDKAPVRVCYRYLNNHRHQLDYRSTLQAGLPIGSGQIESAHRFVIQERLKIPGAWWKSANAKKMLALRILRANRGWAEYWNAA